MTLTDRYFELLRSITTDPNELVRINQQAARSSAHDHTERVDGCFRCDLSADESHIIRGTE